MRLSINALREPIRRESDSTARAGVHVYFQSNVSQGMSSFAITAGVPLPLRSSTHNAPYFNSLVLGSWTPTLIVSAP